MIALAASLIFWAAVFLAAGFAAIGALALLFWLHDLHDVRDQTPPVASTPPNLGLRRAGYPLSPVAPVVFLDEFRSRRHTDGAA